MNHGGSGLGGERGRWMALPEAGSWENAIENLPNVARRRKLRISAALKGLCVRGR